MRPDWWFLCNLTGIFDKIQLIGLVLGCRQFYLSYTCCVRCSAIMNTWKLPLCKSVFWNKQMAHTLQCCEFYFYMHVMEEVRKNFDTKNTSLTYPMQRKVKRKWWENAYGEGNCTDCDIVNECLAKIWMALLFQSYLYGEHGCTKVFAFPPIWRMLHIQSSWGIQGILGILYVVTAKLYYSPDNKEKYRNCT